MVTHTSDQQRVAWWLSAAVRGVLSGLRHLGQLAEEHGQAGKLPAHLGDPAAAWLHQLGAWSRDAADHLVTLQCEACEDFAVWEHPDGERYCAQHAQRFSQCQVCSEVMAVADMVSGTTATGHGSCVTRDDEGGD